MRDSDTFGYRFLGPPSIEVLPGDPPKGVTIELEAPGRNTSVSGHLVDERGVPTEDALLPSGETVGEASAAEQA